MLKITLIVIALLVLAVLGYAASGPDHFRVERSAIIKAPAEKIFPLINDFHQWDAWTPYNKDPAMAKTFGGAPSGAGATYAWQGNSQVGQGNMVISAATPPHKVAVDLHMVKPFEAHNHVMFTLRGAGETTVVTWAMDGKHVYLGKLVGLFMSMDNMIGKDFEAGLHKLKGVAEK